MTKIIHLSDLHMCPPGERVVGFDPAARLQAVIEAVNREHGDADLCVVSGDLTDRGDETSYHRLRALLAGLAVPVHLMLGNHDRRDAFRRVFPHAHDDGAGFVQAAIELGPQRLILLDTLDEARPSAGLLCPSRLAWLERELGARPAAPTMLFLHHPPFGLGVEYFREMLLENGDELEALLDHHPQVIHAAFGHVHFATFGRASARSFSAARGTCHPIRPVLAGMVATYVDRPPSYEIMLFEAGRVIVHHMETAASEDVIAREYADEDGGPGSIDIIRPSRWQG
jgi:3',5'-cyclic AMP phosphodiesterase CpdA